MRHHCLSGWLCAAWLCWLGSGLALGTEKRFELTVDAGKHDRVNVPVKVLLEVPAALGEARSVALSDAAGKRLAAQVTSPGLLAQSRKATRGRALRELHFLLPALKKGQWLALTAAISTDPPPRGGFDWADTPGRSADLSYDGRRVMRYMYQSRESATQEGDTFFKPYHHLFDPTGSRLLTKGDKTGLFPHHRGLFYGFSRISYGDVKGVNTWGCDKDSFQSHQGFLAQEAGSVLGRHLVAVDWHGRQSTVFAKEQRELTAYQVSGGQLVEFASRLSSTVGKVTLDGDPQHAGFQFRAAQEVVDHAKETYYLRPDGKGKPGEFRNWDAKKRDPRCVNLPWNAVSFVIAGKRYTAVYLDQPGNPRESRYSERDYARFGCYFEYELDQGKDLVICYRLWVQEGEMEVPQAAALSSDFIEPVHVSVKAQ